MASEAGEAHFGAPRALEIHKFAAARAPEIEALYNVLKSDAQSAKDAPGSLATPRHLRRRTTSHIRSSRHLFWKKQDENRGKGGSRKRKRSRKNVDGKTADKEKEETYRPCRRVRRRLELQRVRLGEVVVRPDGCRRLSTHLWHAKRFTMTKAWNFSLAAGRAGRGRGSRALLKWVKEAATLHDASYFGLIELQGSREAISQRLHGTVEPPLCFSNSTTLVGRAREQGLLYGNAVLHGFGKAPREAITPISFLWRTPSFALNEGEISGERQLWIWVHPGAFESALKCLKSACCSQLDGVNNVECRPRTSEFGRLEIFGKKALEVVRKVLQPSTRKFGSLHSHQFSGDLSDGVGIGVGTEKSTKLDWFQRAECLPCSAVVALDVLDPRLTRLIKPNRSEETSADLSKIEEGFLDDGCAPGESGSDFLGEVATAEGIHDGDFPANNDRELLANWLNLSKDGQSREICDSPYMWSPHLVPRGFRLAPVSEKKLCKQRSEDRKRYFSCETGKRSGEVMEKLAESSVCPVLLIKGSNSVSSYCGWTIIMLIRWVHAFWVPLVFAGGHVIGLRERRWLASHAGIPYFPNDFPDCPAYAQVLASAVTGWKEANEKRPLAKRSPYFLMSPLQLSVLNNFRTSGHGTFCRTSSDSRNDDTKSAPSLPVQELTNQAIAEEGSGEDDLTTSSVANGDLQENAVPLTSSRLVDSGEGIGSRTFGLSIELDNGDSMKNAAPGSSDLGQSPGHSGPTTGLGGEPMPSLALDESICQLESQQLLGVAVQADLSVSPTGGSTVEMSEQREGGRIEIPSLLRTDEPAGSLSTFEKAETSCDGTVSASRTSFLNFFVARSGAVLTEFPDQGALRGILNDDASQQFVPMRSPKDTVVSSQADETWTSLATDGRVCYLRVLVSLPRKGVLDEGSVVIVPLAEDRENFFRYKSWQGPGITEHRNAKRNSEHAENVEATDITENRWPSDESFSQAFTCEVTSSGRETIGLITSSVPRGSRSSCQGVCRLDSLLKLRTAQGNEGSGVKKSDIFVLTGSRYSSKLRPAFVSLPPEDKMTDFEWL